MSYLDENSSQRTLNQIIQPKAELWRQWFHKSDHKVLQQIEEEIVSNPALKDAGVSRLYDYYKRMTGDNITFDDFLNKDLTLYRGGNTRKSNNMLSYSVLERKAKRFGDTHSITVKPKDTYGMLGDFSEGEVFVPSVRNDGGKAMSIDDPYAKTSEFLNDFDAKYLNEQAASYSTPDDFRKSIVDRIWEQNKKGSGVDSWLQEAGLIS